MNPTLTVPVAENFKALTSPADIFIAVSNIAIFILAALITILTFRVVFGKIISLWRDSKNETQYGKLIFEILITVAVAIGLVSFVIFILGGAGDNLISMLNTVATMRYKILGGSFPTPITNPLKI